MLINRFKGCTNTNVGVLYFVQTLDSLSRIVPPVRFKTGSQKEIQVVALNKTGTQCIYQFFPQNLGDRGHTMGIRQPKQSLPLGI